MAEKGLVPWGEVTGKEADDEPKKPGIHYIAIKDGYQWEQISMFFATDSNKKMADKLIALAEKVNNGKIVIAKPENP